MGLVSSYETVLTPLSGPYYKIMILTLIPPLYCSTLNAVQTKKIDGVQLLLNKLNLAFRSGDKVSVQRDQVEAEEGHQGSLQAED